MSDRLLTTVDISGRTEDGEVVYFDYQDSFGRPQKGLAVYWKGRWHAFRNRCPHWDTPLDTDGDDVFDSASGALICTTHGAQFEPESGRCVLGPCFGQSLRRLDTRRLDDGRLAIDRPGLSL